MVRYASAQVSPIIESLGGTNPAPLPRYRLKLLDGNCIEKTQHRIKELRTLSVGPLPGKSPVVYDPVLRLPISPGCSVRVLCRPDPSEQGIVFQQMTISALVTVLQQLAGNVKLSGFRKHPRSPKKTATEAKKL